MKNVIYVEKYSDPHTVREKYKLNCLNFDRFEGKILHKINMIVIMN